MTAGSFIAQFLLARHLGPIARAGKACGTCGSDAFYPAMPAGVTDHVSGVTDEVWSVAEIVEMVDAAPPKPARAGHTGRRKRFSTDAAYGMVFRRSVVPVACRATGLGCGDA
jgi:hypothetical protein